MKYTCLPLVILADCLEAAAKCWPLDHQEALLRLAGINIASPSAASPWVIDVNYGLSKSDRKAREESGIYGMRECQTPKDYLSVAAIWAASDGGPIYRHWCMRPVMMPDGKVPIQPITYAPGWVGTDGHDVDYVRRGSHEVIMGRVLPALAELLAPIYELAGRDGVWCLAAGNAELTEWARINAQHAAEGFAVGLGIAALGAERTEARWASQQGILTVGNVMNGASMIGVPIRGDIREIDEKWQRRRLNRECGLARAQAAATLRLIGGKTGRKIATQVQLDRRADKDSALTAWASDRQIVAGDGTKVPMLDVLDSTAKAKKARAYAVCLGMQVWAIDRDMIPVMLTVSLQSEWHANPTKGARHPDAGSREHNVKLMVKQMGKLIKQLRNGIRNRCIYAYGIRVPEAHKDGTIHEHLPLWVATELDVAELWGLAVEIFGEGAAVDLMRLDHPQQRVDADLTGQEYTPPPVSSAWASYALDYVMAKPTGAQAQAEAAATRAWASDLGIRRWALWGCGNRLGVWDRVHKDKLARDAALDAGAPPPVLPDAIMDIVQAMAQRRWAAALIALGILPRDVGGARRSAISVLRAPHPLSGLPTNDALVDANTGEYMLWRPIEWRVEPIGAADEDADDDADEADDYTDYYDPETETVEEALAREGAWSAIQWGRIEDHLEAVYLDSDEGRAAIRESAAIVFGVDDDGEGDDDDHNEIHRLQAPSPNGSGGDGVRIGLG
jgi:hypothetical protein